MKKSAKVLILMSIGGIYFCSYFQRIAVPGTIFDELQSAFTLSASGVAALAAIYLYIYGGLQPLVGILVDSWGAGRTILASGLLLSIGSLLFPLSHSVFMLYFTRVLIGIGAAMVFVSLAKEVDELFGVKDFPLFLSFGIIMGYTGGLFGTYPFEQLVRLQGWRAALSLVGILGVACLFIAAVLFYRTGRLRQKKGIIWGGYFLQVLKNRSFYPLILTGSLNFSIYFLLQATIGKKFLQDFCGLSSGKAASFTFIMMLVCMAGVLLAGLGSTYFRRRRPFLLFSALATLASSLMLLAGVQGDWPRGFFLACYILLAMASSLTPVFATSAKELNPREASGTSIGIINASMYIVVALLTSAGGFILDAFSHEAIKTPTAVLYPMEAYRMIFMVCSALAVVSFISSLKIRESAGEALN
jgi:MFS family permease